MQKKSLRTKSPHLLPARRKKKLRHKWYLMQTKQRRHWHLLHPNHPQLQLELMTIAPIRWLTTT